MLLLCQRAGRAGFPDLMGVSGALAPGPEVLGAPLDVEVLTGDIDEPLGGLPMPSICPPRQKKRRSGHLRFALGISGAHAECFALQLQLYTTEGLSAICIHV